MEYIQNGFNLLYCLLFLFRSKPKLELPKSLRSEETIPRVNRAIMNDVETADFSMRCANKTFRVHKSFLCSRSSVLRAMILADMEEGRKGEVFIPDIDEDTISAMITFIYTGEVDIGEGLDVEMVARAADKYDLPGFLDIFCFKVKKEDISNETVADLLITANRYESEELKKIAELKLRANNVKEMHFVNSTFAHIPRNGVRVSRAKQLNIQ